MSSVRVMYVAGPGDVASTYQHWRRGQHDPSESNITYSGQFFSTLKNLGMHGYIISSHPDAVYLEEDDFTIEHRPNKLDKAAGAKFHLGQIRYGLNIIKTALRYKPDYVLVSSGTHWFMLGFLPLLGVKVIPTIHCVLWPKYGQRKKINKLIDSFNGLFFKYASYEVMSASKEISRQLASLKVSTNKVNEFLPYYDDTVFKKVVVPEPYRRPFRLLYIGRIEEVKGVFDLLQVYEQLTEEGLDLELDFCGDGASFKHLSKLVRDKSKVHCHGHCNKENLLQIVNRCHLIIVPTRTEFVEGFNQVVVESVLFGRPVVTSDVCPAIEYVLPAVCEAVPDDVESYKENIRKLYQDVAYYEEKQSGCNLLQDMFYDEKNSWGYLLSTLLESKNAK